MFLKTRQKNQKMSEATEIVYEGVETLVNLEKRKVVYWNSTTKLACLDIDFHSKIKDEDLVDKIKRVYPAPMAYDISQRKGLHLYYEPVGNHNADELAALAYFSAARIFTSCTGIEVISKTFIVNPVKVLTDDQKPTITAGRVFNGFGRNVSQEKVNAVYERFGKSPGESGQVATNLCPFTNHNIKVDVNPSVRISPKGVHCFRCDRSVTLESLAENSHDTRLEHYTKRMLHWDIMSLYIMRFVRHDLRAAHTEEISRLAYRALLNFIYPGDYRVDWCLKRLNLYRDVNNFWVSSQGTPFKDNEARNLIKLLPYLNTGGYKLDKDGVADETKPFAQGKSLVAALPDTFSTTGEDLTDYMPKSCVIRGVDLAFSNIEEEDELLVRKYYVSKECEKFSLSPTPADKAKEAVDVISRAINVYPISHENYQPVPATNLVQILLAQIFTEYSGERPILIATGVSGSGKTLIPQLASAILRYSCTVCPGGLTPEQRQEAFGAALHKGVRCFVHDESLKDGSPNSYLNLNAATTYSRVMYVGFKTLRNTCCSILTGITFPEEFRNNGQFMRRATVLPHLSTKKEWNASSVMSGFLKNPKIKQACDDLLNYLAQFLPHDNDVDNFSVFWEGIKGDLDPFFTESGDVFNGNLESPKEARILEILDILIGMQEEGQISKASKTRKATYISRGQSSKTWQLVKDAFVGEDLSGALPVSVHDFFNEYSIGKELNIKDLFIEPILTRDNFYIRLRSGRKILKFNGIDFSTTRERILSKLDEELED